MSIEELTQLQLSEAESEFGEHVTEEVAASNNQIALLQLSTLCLRRLDELGGVVVSDDLLTDLSEFLGESA